jgi:hypothetical protein
LVVIVAMFGLLFFHPKPIWKRAGVLERSCRRLHGIAVAGGSWRRCDAGGSAPPVGKMRPGSAMRDITATNRAAIRAAAAKSDAQTAWSLP